MVNMKTLEQFRADTGLPIDMLTALLDEYHVKYDMKSVEEWESKEVHVGEGLNDVTKNLFVMNEPIKQEIPSSLLYSLSTEGSEAEVVWSDPEGKAVALSPCPFFPCQAGQEGDRGDLIVNGECVHVTDTVRIDWE